MNRLKFSSPRTGAILAWLLAATSISFGDDLEKVGRNDAGRTVIPVNRVLTPAGRQVEMPKMRPQVAALSPDFALLVTSGLNELVVVDPARGDILQRVPLPRAAKSNSPDVVSSEILKPDTAARGSYTGLIFSPDGSRLFLSDVNGTIKVFSVSKDHKIVGLNSMALSETDAPRRKDEIPAGLAVSRDGRRLYVAGNLSNRLLELELPSGKVLRQFEVGALPYEIVLVGDKACVSNWGGRRTAPDSVTGPAGRGTIVRVDPVRFIANEGSVSVVDLVSGKVTKEIMADLHASGMVLSPNGRYVCVANAGSDTISVIDSRKDSVVETISLRWHANDIFGASPNALTFDARGENLYVCNGSQNAVAAISFRPANRSCSA